MRRNARNLSRALIHCPKPTEGCVAPRPIEACPPAADQSPTQAPRRRLTTKAAALSARAAFEALRANSIQLFSVKQAAHSTFRPDLAEVGRIVGKELRDSGITKEEASGLQAICQAAAAAVARQTGMSPKQIWTPFGPRILWEPDITRNDAGEIQIRGSSLEAFAGSFQQAEAAMESPDGLGPMMPEYNGKPSEGLACLRQAKTGAIPALFYHKDFGDLGIMYGKPGKPNREYADGYGLAHIDAKHPEAADQIQRFLDVAEADDARLSKTNTDPDRVVLTDGVYFLAMTKVWRGEPKHSKSTWIIIVYEKGRPQNQVATSAVSRGRSPWMPQPAAAKDSTPDWEKALSKFKGTPFSRLRGQLLPRITVDRPVEECQPLDAPPRIRACLPFHGDGRCSGVTKIGEC